MLIVYTPVLFFIGSAFSSLILFYVFRLPKLAKVIAMLAAFFFLLSSLWILLLWRAFSYPI